MLLCTVMVTLDCIFVNTFLHFFLLFIISFYYIENLIAIFLMNHEIPSPNSGWQQEYWRAHCGDYCAFLGYVGARELRALGVLEEVLDDPMWDEEQKDMIRESVNGGHLQCYLFQCLHCGKHLVWMDFD